MTALELVKVYGYNSAPPTMQTTMMQNLRPRLCDEYPTIVPPVMAPKLATTWVTVTELASNLYSDDVSLIWKVSSSVTYDF